MGGLAGNLGAAWRTFALALSLCAFGAAARAQEFGPVADAPPATQSSADAASNSPQTARRVDAESKPLGPAPRRADHAGGGGAPAPGSNSAAAGGQDWLVRTGGALAIVLMLIFALRWGVRRLASRTGLAGQIGAGGRAPSGIREFLGRYPVARGQTLALLRLDRRVLLVSQSSSGFSTLAEVTDPDEVASLLVQTRDDEGSNMAQRFSGLLRDMERDPAIMGDDADELISTDASRQTHRGTLPPEPLPEAPADPTSSLRRRLRALRAAGGGRAA